MEGSSAEKIELWMLLLYENVQEGNSELVKRKCDQMTCKGRGRRLVREQAARSNYKALRSFLEEENA